MVVEALQDFRFIGGSQQISDKIAAKMGADRVITGEPVRTIRWTDSGRTGD